MSGYIRSLGNHLLCGLRRLWGTHGSPAGSAERRQWARFPSHVTTTCQPTSASDATGLPARVRNVSCGGINLLVPHGFDPGTLLHVDVPGPDKDSDCLLACVIQAAPAVENAWSLGCSFIRELEEQELQRFLEGRPIPESLDTESDRSSL